MIRALGVCYYPEHWPEDKWVEDARGMRETGLTWVRIGEFAWSRLEPSPGELRFDWLDRAIEILGREGLKIVLGTPTATPPRWMLDRHPDMLPHDREGRPRKFGSRRHYCFSHAGYREECARITGLLADRYGRHPHIAAWQTDNEYGCHDTTRSYSPAALAAFRQWLEEKYASIDALNAAWGNVFWSMEYRRFDEIDLPNLTVTEANPSHRLDFYRFSSDQVVSFNRIQTEIIRARSDAPIAHNYMGRTVEFDHYAVGADLDIASWDSYPLGFLEDRVDDSEDWKRQFMRQGDPDNQAFHHDLYRAVGRGRWWIMEQQPGPVNWAPYNPAPLPGMVRLWTWEAFAHGAETVCYFRWRQAPMAQEQMHAGLLRPDSADAPARNEVARVATELGNRAEVQPTGQAKIGLVFDYASAWTWSIQPQGRDFDYFRLVFETYRGLRATGLNIDLLPPTTADLSGYALVLVPGLLNYSDALRRALEIHDGVVALGPRTGSKTDALSIPQSLPPNFPPLDVTVTRVETLRPNGSVGLTKGGTLQIWREFTEGTAEIVEHTDDGEAAIRRSGHLVYLCGWPDKVAMRRIMRELVVMAGLAPFDLPDTLRRRETEDEVFWFNYGTAPLNLASIIGDDRLPQSLSGADLHRQLRHGDRA
jgi:beta-galactosidase